MEIKLKYFVEKDKQYVDLDTGEPWGFLFDEHTIVADVDGQIFKESFVVTSAMKDYNYREGALIFGIKLQAIGKAIEKQAKHGNPEMFTSSSGETIVTF